MAQIGPKVFLATVVSIVVFFTLGFRIDTLDDLALIRVWDVGLGLVLSSMFARSRASNERAATPKKRVPAFMGVIVVWGLITGSLLGWHEMQVQIRWAGPRTKAQDQIRLVETALRQYAKDNGEFPSQEHGLEALCKNTGVENWAGPYLQLDALVDPRGRPLEFRVCDDRVEIRSVGRDGQTGTADDVLAEVVKERRHPKRSAP